MPAKPEPQGVARVVENKNGRAYLLVADWPCGEANGPMEILGLEEGAEQINSAISAMFKEADRMAEALEAERESQLHFDSCQRCDEFGQMLCGAGSDLAEKAFSMREESLDTYNRDRNLKGETNG